jgi:hypothetical protein
MAAKGGICKYWKCHHHHHLDYEGLKWPFKWVLGFLPWWQCGGHFPLALYFGGEFCTAVAKKQKSTAKVCKSRHILMEKRSEVTIFRQWVPEGRWEANNKFYFAGWPRGKFDSWHLLAEDDRLASPLPWQNWNKKTLALHSGAKTFLQCLYMMTHNMVFEHIL